MSLSDRIVPICDLLLGAAYADNQLAPAERAEMRKLLADLSGAALSPEIEHRIDAFDPKTFDLAATARAFSEDSEDDRRRLLFLVAAISDADEEFDLDEDEFLRALATALALPPSALEGMVLDVEIEELRTEFAKVRKGPPPIPGKKSGAGVDVDID